MTLLIAHAVYPLCTPPVRVSHHVLHEREAAALFLAPCTFILVAHTGGTVGVSERGTLERYSYS